MCSLPSGAGRPLRKIDTWADRFLEYSIVGKRYRKCQLMPGGREGHQTFPKGQSSLPCDKGTTIKSQVWPEKRVAEPRWGPCVLRLKKNVSRVNF